MAISDQVIVVDDDEAMRNSLEALFIARDYSVLVFGSASDLVSALPGLSPACIVTDVCMPEMDGITLVRTLKAEMGVAWPVIVMNGCGGPGETEQALEAGAFAMLAKPFTPARLLALVAEATAAYETAAGPSASS